MGTAPETNNVVKTHLHFAFQVELITQEGHDNRPCYDNIFKRQLTNQCLNKRLQLVYQNRLNGYHVNG